MSTIMYKKIIKNQYINEFYIIFIHSMNYYTKYV